MASDEFPTSWTDPNYVATIVGVLAIGVLYAYSVTTQSGLVPEEITVVILVVTIPVMVAHGIARRWL